MKISKRILVAAVATLGCGAVMTASAQTASSAPGANSQHRGGHGHFRRPGPGGRYTGELLRALHEVVKASPSTYNKASIDAAVKAVFKANKPADRPTPPAAGTVVSNLTAVWENGASAANVATAGTAASARVQKDAALAHQVYAALAPFSGLQAAVVNQLQTDVAKAEARRAQWQQKHPQTAN